MMTSQGPSPPFEPRPTGFFTGAVKWVYQPWRSSSPNADPKNKNAALPPRSQPNRRHARLMARPSGNSRKRNGIAITLR